MERQNFKNIRLIIGEPSYELRVGLKSAFYAEGFDQNHIHNTDKVSAVRDAVVNNQADLIVCDAHLSDGDFDNLIHQIRHNKVGNNPFVNIITLIPTADQQTIMKSMNSGTDDMLVKPISPGQLMERVLHMIHERKPFVVTTDYIGPNRRTGHRPGTQEIPQFEVPNPLKAKFEDEPDEYKFQTEIDEMTEVLNEQKIERHAYQIVYLVERLVPAYTEGKVDESITTGFDRLLAVSNDISHRLAGSRFVHWDEICRSLVDVVSRIGETPLTPNAKDLDSLWKVAEAFKSEISPAEQRLAKSAC